MKQKRPPTKEQFSNWTEREKAFWVRYDLNGQLITPGMPVWLFYTDPDRDYAIRAVLDEHGSLKEWKIMTIKQAMDDAGRNAANSVK